MDGSLRPSKAMRCVQCLEMPATAVSEDAPSQSPIAPCLKRHVSPRYHCRRSLSLPKSSNGASSSPSSPSMSSQVCVTAVGGNGDESQLLGELAKYPLCPVLTC